MGWLIAALVLTGLAMLPLGVCVRYYDNGLLVKIIIGPVHMTVYPSKKKKDKIPEGHPKNKVTLSAESAVREDREQNVRDFYPMIQVGMKFLNQLRRKLCIKHLECKLILAGGDPCDLAIHYGRTWAALGNLMPQIERFFRIKKRNLQVACDFTGVKTLFTAYMDLRITLGRLLYLVLRYGIQAVREYMKLKNLRKGGAQT